MSGDLTARDVIARTINDLFSPVNRRDPSWYHNEADHVLAALAAAGWRLERDRVEFGVRYASGKTSLDGHRNRGTAEFIVQECPGSRLIQRTAGVPAGEWEVCDETR